MKDLAAPKRLTLLLCLLHQAQVQVRDDLAEMLIKRMKRIHGAGKEELERLRAEHRETIETLVAALADVLGVLAGDPSDAAAGQQVTETLAAHGGMPQLLRDCDVPLLGRFLGSQRAHRTSKTEQGARYTIRCATPPSSTSVTRELRSVLATLLIRPKK